jgi:ubiquinone/menaquinone biosynthesis C-methylase UbiE/DNA-binding transcriptional ArsR family regulator
MTMSSLIFDDAIAALEAVAESTRLRLVALLSESELTVTELTAILGQSQPRISRHLKLLADASILERNREGAWAFFRLGEGAAATLARSIVERIGADDAVIAADRSRLKEVRAARAQQANAYFAKVAIDWDRIRALHISDKGVEAAMAELIGKGRINAMLDIGTGTGRMLELFAGQAGRAVGIDQSAAMLSIARANLERHAVRNAQLKQGDIYALPVERDAYDLVLVHQVLHFLDDPARAIREMVRVLAPGGRLMIVDFAPHEKEFLRTEHAHRRLGFAREEIAGVLADAGLDLAEHRLLADDGRADGLTVSIWLGKDRRIRTDGAIVSAFSEVA